MANISKMVKESNGISDMIYGYMDVYVYIYIYIWGFAKSWGYPLSLSILEVVSLINQAFWETPIYGKAHMMDGYVYIYLKDPKPNFF